MSLPETTASRRVDIDWRWALPRIAAVFLVTRLLVLVVAIGAETTQSPPPGLIRVDDRPVLSSLTLWDSEYYVGIAADGYHAEPSPFPDYAFYPGYPIVARAASLLTLGDVSLAAVLAANVVFACALVALYALSVRFLSPERAVLSLWFLALAPPNFVFAMAYGESLFLALAVSAFLAAEARRPWLAGIAVALAALTRAPGILLVLPLLVLYVQREGVRSVRSWVPLLLAPIALAAFFGYLWWLTGDPLAPVRAQGFWNPAEPVAAELQSAIPADESAAVSRVIPAAPSAVIVYWVGSIVFYTFLFVYFRKDRIPAAYWLVAILAVLSVFLTGRLQSAPRYIASAWPFAWVLAGRHSRIGRGLVLAAFGLGQAAFAWLAFTWHVTP